MDRRFTCLLFIYMGVSMAVEDQIPDIASLCPFNDFCKTKAKYWVDPEYTPCCQKCSCAPDCYLTATCCPDALEDTNSTDNFPRRPSYPCLNLHIVLNAERKIPPSNPLTSFEKASYRIIDRCPDDKSSIYYKRCESRTNVEDYIVVSDAHNEKNFKNRHCALCHGVEDVIEWDLVVDCPEIVTKTFESFEERDEFVLKACRLRSRPPNRQIEELTRCYSNIELIDTCYTYGLNAVDAYALKIDAACNEGRYIQNTVVKDPRSSRLYSNIYCYLCNEWPQTEGPTICPIEDDSITTAKKLEFSAMLGKTSGARQVQDDRLCARTEVWDNITGVCRTLQCPLGTIPFNGRCESSVKHSEGFTLFVLFEVVFLEEDPVYFDTLSKKSAEHIDLLLEETNFGCGFCETQTFQNGLTIFYRLPIYTTENCSVSTLLECARSLIQRNENTTFGCTGDSEVTRFSLKFYTDEMPSAEIYHKTGDGKRCMLRPTQIDTGLLRDCPKIVIPNNEIQPINSSADSVVLHGSLSREISVCMDTYFKVHDLHDMSNSDSGVTSMYKVKLIFLTISIVHIYTYM